MNEETISNVLTGETDIAKMSRDDFVEMLKCLGRMYFSRVMNCVDGTGKSDKEWTALSCIFSRVVEAITAPPRNCDVETAASDLTKEVERYMRLVNPSVAGGCDVERALERCKDALAAASRSTAATGNATALHEALTDAEKTLYDSSRSMYGIPPHLHALLARIRAALAAPQRNCDVGTPEEQDKRFDAFCKSYKEHHGNCFGCAALRTSGDCKVSWMRMPCEEKGAE